MPSYARQPLGGWRNEACLIPISVVGLDLTGVASRAQVRMGPDVPGAALLDLEPVADPAATGIRFVNVTTVGGVPTSHLMWQVSKAGMQGLPYSGEIGDPWIGAYALQIGGVTRMAGPFAAVASPIDSDNAPANRAVSYGSLGCAGPVNGAVLTIGDDGVTVSVSGADLIAPLVTQAQASAAQGISSALTAQQQATIATIKAQIAQQAANDGGNYLSAIRAVVGNAPVTATLPLEATSRAIMAGFTGMVAGKQALLSEFPRSGVFTWSTLNLSAKIATDPLQGIYVPPTAAPSGASGAWVRLDVSRPCPEWWGGGAGGDDTAAAAALGDYVTAAGGGLLEFRAATTYNLGAQDKVADGSFMFKPRRLIEVRNCTLPVTIRGNGARLRFNPGLYFGAFKSDGTAAAPNAQGSYSAPCLTAMIDIEGCSGGVAFDSPLELDGNVAAMKVGGNWGDTGWQIGGDGIYFTGNTGMLDMSSVRAHHFPRDGIQGSTPNAAENSPSTTTMFRSLRLHNNCRNNLSALGGRRWTFIGCDFIEAAKNTPFGSAPGSGVDLEAEQALIRDFHFIDCSFIGNTNNGMVADSGDTSGVKFDSCRFISGGGPAAWPNKPNMRFSDCLFVGPVYPFWHADAATANQFRRCVFTDDQTLTPYGPVPAGPILNGGGGCDNVLFEACTVRTTSQIGVYLPGSKGAQAIWRDGTITSTVGGAIFGAQVEGQVAITGNYDGSGMTLLGQLVSGGVDLTLFSQAFPSTTIPALGHVSISIDGTGRPVFNGMRVDAGIDINMHEIMVSSYVTAGVVVVVLFNPTGAAVTLDAGTLTARASMAGSA